MVGASPAVVESASPVSPPFTTDHAALAELMGTYPLGAFAPPEDRVRWLFELARALDRLGYLKDSAEARDRALLIVRAVMSKVAGTGKVAGSDRR